MRNLITCLIGIGALYALAYLPSFLCFVAIGPSVQSWFGISQRVFFMVFNFLFVTLFLGMLFYNSSYHRYR